MFTQKEFHGLMDMNLRKWLNRGTVQAFQKAKSKRLTLETIMPSRNNDLLEEITSDEDNALSSCDEFDI